MNKKLFSLLTAGIFAMLSACGDTLVDADNASLNVSSSDTSFGVSSDASSDAPVQTKAKLHVLVRDASTGLPLEASVKLLSTGQIDTTNTATGTLSFEDIFVGEHIVLVEKEGYASMVYNVSIYGQSDQNIYIANESTVDAQLYPLSSSLDGYVFYTDISGASLPAKDAKVRIQLTSTSIVDRIFEATVDANGKFVFPSLPAVGTSYNIWILEYKTYGTLSAISDLRASLIAGSAAHSPLAGKYEEDITLFDFLGYKSVINSSDSVVFEFSDSIDVKKVTNGAITVDGQIADKIWKGNKLILAPFGKWTGNFRVYFNENLWSVKGKELSRSQFTNSGYYLSVTVLGEPLEAAKISGLAQADTSDYNSYSVTLKWNKIQGATRYRIFGKASAGTKKEFFTEIADVADTSANIDFSSYISYYSNYIYNLLGLSNPGTTAFLNGDSVVFMVQAYNSTSETQLNGAATVSVKDKKKPTVSVYPGASSSRLKVPGDSVVYFGNGTYYTWVDSYSYYLDLYSLTGFTNYYPINAYGLSPEEFMFYSDIGYHLSLNLPGFDLEAVSGDVYFSEPMDTTSITEAKFTSTVASRLEVNTEWIDDRTLRLTVNIKNGNDNQAAINSLYKISGLKDKNGNDLEIEYTATKTDNLYFRFKIASYTDP